MIDNLTISEANRQAHVDIELELSRLKKVWYHFEIRCSNGNIVDLVTREHVTYENIIPPTKPTPHDSRKRRTDPEIRDGELHGMDQ